MTAPAPPEGFVNPREDNRAGSVRALFTKGGFSLAVHLHGHTHAAADRSGPDALANSPRQHTPNFSYSVISKIIRI